MKLENRYTSGHKPDITPTPFFVSRSCNLYFVDSIWEGEGII